MDSGIRKSFRSNFIRQRLTPQAVAVAALLGFAVASTIPYPAQGSHIQKDLPLVWVLSTGGTIAGKGASSTSLAEYKSGSLRGEDLVKGVPEIQQYANVKVEQISNVSSADVTIDIWIKLANRINRIFAEDPKVAGVVVTHGTNTLEETAYFLNLTVKHDRPVVLVGSMMNDEINSARDATKTNTYRVETFRAPELGYLGYVDADQVSFYRTSTKRHTVNSEFDVSGIKTLPEVERRGSQINGLRVSRQSGGES